MRNALKVHIMTCQIHWRSRSSKISLLQRDNFCCFLLAIINKNWICLKTVFFSFFKVRSIQVGEVVRKFVILSIYIFCLFFPSLLVMFLCINVFKKCKFITHVKMTCTTCVSIEDDSVAQRSNSEQPVSVLISLVSFQ